MCMVLKSDLWIQTTVLGILSGGSLVGINSLHEALNGYLGVRQTEWHGMERKEAEAKGKRCFSSSGKSF